MGQHVAFQVNTGSNLDQLQTTTVGITAQLEDAALGHVQHALPPPACFASAEGAVFHFPIELGQHHHGNAEILGHQLEPAADLADADGLVLLRATAALGAAQQLEVVHDDELDPAVALAALLHDHVLDLRYRDRGPVADEQRHLDQLIPGLQDVLHPATGPA